MAAPPPPPPFANSPNVIAPPPLPLGWTEHVAPGGQLYYFNTVTKQSTYVRPLPNFPVPSFATGALPTQAAPLAGKQKKKEKPKVKTPVPGTPWLRVVTTAGNVFYTHTERKESVWTVPEEIRDAVAQLEREEKEREEIEASKKQEEEEAQRKAVQMEVERIKKEVEAAGKRKATEEPEPLEEVIVTKKARVEEDEDEDDSEEEEEEDWQREAAAQLAAEAEEEERRKKDEEEQRKREEEEELKRKEKERGMPVLNMPNRVELSIEEAKALFKTLLREKNINHLLPWDTALPQFISDPRYVLLPSVSARREAFDEYCRDRAREVRQAKLAQNASTAEEKVDPMAEFDKLLRDEVKSTRTSWSEWRRTWKKDRRFSGWGRDDREREKKFREWLKELGEQKRKAARKAEADFFALLKEKVEISGSSTWKDIKRGLDKDRRYDAVGSSSLREELFNTYVKTLSGEARLPPEMKISEAAEDNEEASKQKRNERMERKERAVKERDEQVKRERERVVAQMARSRSALSREESELEFLTLLTDAIREPTATWESSLDQLKTDPRFTHSPLPANQQQVLLHRHVSALRAKHTSALHALFTAHAPALDTPFSTLPISSIQTSLPAIKLRLDADVGALEYEYRSWCDERIARARKEFQEMLDENAFVEFWGRMRKMKEEGEGGMKVDVGAEDLAGEEEGEGENGKIDLKALAKSVDVKEIERVLKNDKRYVIFDHIPEKRETWIRAHVEKLAAPKLSVHVAEHGH